MARLTAHYMHDAYPAVIVSGLPANCRADEIMDLAGPREVRFVPNYVVSASLNGVRRLLSDFGTLESFETSGTRPGERKIRATAQFASPHEVERVIGQLHNLKLRCADSPMSD